MDLDILIKYQIWGSQLIKCCHIYVFFLNIPILYLLCYACHKAYLTDFHPDCGGAVEPYIRHDYKIDKGEASTNL